MGSGVRRWDDPAVLGAVAAGGALGSLARWWVGELLDPGRTQFPWETFLVNVSGAFAVGVLMVVVIDVRPGSRLLSPFLGIGVLGGFTTFSTYALDTRTLVAAGRAPLAAAYLLGTLVAGLLAVWLGILSTRRAVGRRS
jgi:CrcB protein